MLYEEVFKKLNERRVKYLVAGGVATVLYGVVRFTADLDLIIDFSAGNIEKLFLVLRELHYRPRLPVTLEEFRDRKTRQEWIKQKNMVVFSFIHSHEPMKTIDLFVDEKVSYQKLKKVVFKAQGMVIPAVSLADLKKLKAKAGRPQDIADIYSLGQIEELRKKRKKP